MGKTYRKTDRKFKQKLKNNRKTKQNKRRVEVDTKEQYSRKGQ